MKKMIYFAAFAIMMAMGMNANAKVSAKHNEFHMNDKGRVEVRYNGHHNDFDRHHGKKLSKHELRKIEERRRMEERRRIEEMRRREAARRHHHMAHHHEVVVVDNKVAAGVAGVAVGAAVAALVGALMQ